VKRVLLLATTTGYQIRSFGAAAEKLGVRLIFGSDRCDQLEDPWWDRAVPVRFHDDAASVAAIQASLDSPPDGILAVGDRPVTLAAEVAAAYGLAGHDPAAAAASRDKVATRTALAGAGLPVPRFLTLEADASEDQLAAAAERVRYPAVVKPRALSASRGVIRADGPAALIAAIGTVRHILRSPDVLAERDPRHAQLIVEDFVPGREFAIEGLLTAGAFRALAIFDKPDPLDGPFFEETIYVTPSREAAAVQERIIDTTARAAAALGLRHGPIHAECRVNDAGVYMLEVAARPIGGLCSKALRFGPAGRVSLEEVLLRHAVGEDVAACIREPAASAVMMMPIPRRGILRRVDGIDAARAVRGVVDVQITAKLDSLLVPLPEGRSYLGFIFASADTPGEAEGALREAHGRLRVTLDRELTVTT
jgi:formate-dependent phosphoribosylglycinamide formyltransferase (GAR transformylase)